MTPIPPDCPSSSAESGPNCSNENYSNNGPEIPFLESEKRTMMVILFFFP
jgi:hypothetical protein